MFGFLKDLSTLLDEQQQKAFLNILDAKALPLGVPTFVDLLL